MADNIVLTLAVAAVVVTWLITRGRQRHVCRYCPFAKATPRRRRPRYSAPTRPRHMPGDPPTAGTAL